MDAKFQPSFIPKQPIASVPTAIGSRISIFSVIATIIFIVTLGLAGASLIAVNVLDKDIANLNQTILDSKNSFELSTIAELKRVGAQTRFANELLNKHVALSKFLEVLGDSTYQNVAFKSFTASTEGEKVTVSLAGTAGSYNSLILQQALFENVDFLKEAKFSGFSLGDSGSVTFVFMADLDSKLVDYKNYLSSN